MDPQHEARTVPSHENPPGLSPPQFEAYAEIVRDAYSQHGTGGLAAHIAQAADNLRANPGLVADEATRKLILAQDPVKTAGELCTSVSRYLDLLLLSAMGKTRSMPSFADWYLQLANAKAVTDDPSASGIVCYVRNERALIEPWLTVPYAYSEIARFPEGVTGFYDDEQMLAKLADVNPKPLLVSVREGPNAVKGESTHSYLTALCQDGLYHMLDTWFTGWIDGDLSARYGPKQPRFLHFLYWYTT